ncbi:cytochrome P450 4c3 [Tetranychus urticae]|uniref:Cytochrome P450 n=1 Tax=Tetranychus urticae TaxID=32264 RepID=T1KDQ2_TETUR|nr:cytochrome P450 4c3 [Tetranychus urticae]
MLHLLPSWLDSDNRLTLSFSSLLPIHLFLVASVFSFFVIRRLIEWRRVCQLMAKIPGPPCHWLLGHAKIVLELDKVKFPYGTYVLIYQMLTSTPLIYGKERIVSMWLGIRPFVFLFTPEAVEVVLSSHSLIEKAAEYDFLKPWLGLGLVTSSKNKWKSRRKLLTPAFHFRILNDFLPIINENAEILINKLNQLTDNQSGQSSVIDILDYVTLTTLDVICETAMGIKVNCQTQESEYVTCLHQVSELFLIRISRPWLWPDWAFAISPHGRRYKRCLNVMKTFTMKVIKQRKAEWIEAHENGCKSQEHLTEDQDVLNEKTHKLENKYETKRMAFLDLLMEHHLKNNVMTIEDVREEVDTFMFAGHDTTAMSISWTLYILGLYKDIQEKVRDEIDAILESSYDNCETNGFTVEQLKQMKYLDCVLKEVQRVYPVAPFIGRELSEDTMINGYLVPKGTTCAIFTYLLHRNEETFPKPEEFDPDRFLPENSSGRHPYAYIPFSAGPRNCIGQKFAVMEEKAILARVLSHFIIHSVDQRDKLIISGEMVLRSRNGLRIVLTRRNSKLDTPIKNKYNNNNVIKQSCDTLGMASRNI